MVAIRRFSAAAGVLTLLTCAPAFAQQYRLTGTAVCGGGPNIPQPARLTVDLDDITIAGAPPVVVARTQTPAGGKRSIPFSLSFPAGTITGGHRYTLAARIANGSAVIFSNGKGQPVDPLSDGIYPIEIVLSPSH